MVDRLPALAAADGDRIDGISAWHRRPLPLGIGVRRVPVPGRALVAIWQLARLPPLPSGFDVVLAPSLAVPPARGTALVVFVADVAFLHLPEAYPRWGRAFHRRGLRNVIRAGAGVLTSSTASADDLRAAGVRDVTVIPLGVDSPVLDEADARRRRIALGLDDAEPYVLALGTAEPRKNLEGALAAVARLPYRLVVAGYPGWVTPPPEAGERITVLGQVSDEDRSALYMGAAVFCYPSLYEGFGLPVVEAMAHGTPVVTSTVSSLPEVAGDAAVLVDPRDTDALADALARVVEDAATRSRLVAAGRARAAMYTWEASAAATWAAMKDAAS